VDDLVKIPQHLPHLGDWRRVRPILEQHALHQRVGLLCSHRGQDFLPFLIPLDHYERRPGWISTDVRLEIVF